MLLLQDNRSQKRARRTGSGWFEHELKATDDPQPYVFLVLLAQRLPHGTSRLFFNSTSVPVSGGLPSCLVDVLGLLGRTSSPLRLLPSNASCTYPYLSPAAGNNSLLRSRHANKRHPDKISMVQRVLVKLCVIQLRSGISILNQF